MNINRRLQRIHKNLQEVAWEMEISAMFGLGSKPKDRELSMLVAPENWFRKQYQSGRKKKTPEETDPKRLFLMVSGLEQALFDAVHFVTDIEYEDPQLKMGKMKMKKFQKILDDYHTDVRGIRIEMEMEGRN